MWIISFFFVFFICKLYFLVMRDKYETYAHAKTHIRYHLIFSTKYRKDCLSSISAETAEVFSEISERSRFKVLKIGIDKNHVHLLVKSCPTMSISKIVQRLKSMSTYLLWSRCNGVLRGYYWKGHKLWTRGYFCSTIGEVNESTVSNYIENQG